MYPEEFHYTKDHEWVRVDGETGTIGITDHAQKELGDIVYVELPKAGDALRAAEVFGTVESVKAVSEIYAPVSGEVTEVNTRLNEHPELLNSDPHGAAWLIRVRLSDPKEVQKLMSAAEYEAYIGEAGSH
ncbi:MAG TPA: glycine cleavage system protein GcvH [Terriglobia bacterium]|jgi:glycine cleavage system H protein|nr:glycine cleavage system protein GcvH [Terriglobia bacterium]